MVYVNDIVDDISCNIKLFADDTILYVTVDDYDQSTQVLNANLATIQRWADQWLVRFNPEKTKLLNISNKAETDHENYPVFFNGIQCENVKEHKHLG